MKPGSVSTPAKLWQWANYALTGLGLFLLIVLGARAIEHLTDRAYVQGQPRAQAGDGVALTNGDSFFVPLSTVTPLSPVQPTPDRQSTVEREKPADTKPETNSRRQSPAERPAPSLKSDKRLKASIKE